MRDGSASSSGAEAHSVTMLPKIFLHISPSIAEKAPIYDCREYLTEKYKGHALISHKETEFFMDVMLKLLPCIRIKRRLL